ncbi:MAG: DUF1989 domain-containing protein, partial [Arenicellales bacterium]|nr:DUF1989 domain-containing protein [Arenicellales bacterium]
TNMSDICPTCGLPSDLCVCETIAKEDQQVVVRTVKRRFGKLMTVVEDTCGLHDTIYGCCSVEVDDVRFGENNGKGCQSNFELELSKHGLNENDVAANINFFMYVPVESSGALGISPGLSKAGDYVSLLAEQDVLAVLSNCPERLNNAAGGEPTPVQVQIYSGQT